MLEIIACIVLALFIALTAGLVELCNRLTSGRTRERR